MTKNNIDKRKVRLYYIIKIQKIIKIKERRKWSAIYRWGKSKRSFTYG